MSELHDISNDGSKPQSAGLVKKTANSGVVDMLEQEKQRDVAISSEPTLPAVSPRPVSGPLTLHPTQDWHTGARGLIIYFLSSDGIFARGASRKLARA